MYSLRVIHTFLSVVRHQSITKAAQELNLAQTTVCKRLSVLEEEIGCPLLERGKGIKQLSLTPAGEEFIGIAERLYFISGEVKTLKSYGPKLSLTVGSVDSFNTFLLTQVYQNINKNYPTLRMHIITHHSIELYSAVEKKHVDVGFALRDRVHPNVNVSKCFESPMVLLRYGAKVDSALDPVSPASLDPDFELYLQWGGQQYQVWHDRWWDPFYPSRIKLDSVNMLLDLMKNTNLWAVVPTWLAKVAQQRGQYSVCQLTDPPPHYTCYKLTHKYPTSSTQKAMEIFNKCFQLNDIL